MNKTEKKTTGFSNCPTFDSANVAYVVLKLFRKNQFMRSLLLLPVALLLNLNVLLNPSIEFPVYNDLIDPYLQDFYLNMPITHWLVLSLLFFTKAVLLNRLVIINRLSNTITLYPGLFLIVLMSAFPIFEFVSSVSVALLAFILLLSNLMYINARTSVVNKIFNVGLYLGLMMILVLPNLLFFFMIIISISWLTSLKQRTIFNLLNGVLLPFLFASLYALLWDLPFGDVTTNYSDQFGIGNISIPESLESWLIVVLTSLYLLIVLITYNTVVSKKSIQSVRKINVITVSIVFILLIHVISGLPSKHNLILLTPVFAYYTAEGVLKFKRESNAELILILLVILGIILPFVA